MFSCVMVAELVCVFSVTICVMCVVYWPMFCTVKLVPDMPIVSDSCDL